MADHGEYRRIDGLDEEYGDDVVAAVQPRGPEYAELEIADEGTFGDEDDARFHEQFSTYDPHSIKATVWKRRRFSLVHVCLAVVGCLGVYITAS
ncbi:hypothetical protein GGH18_005865, partial [Coemansia sp. RSA 530]